MKVFRLSVFLIVFFGLFLSAKNTYATVAVGYDVQSGITHINYTTNHGYEYSSNLLFYTHAADVVEHARQKLASDYGAQNIPVLIYIPSPVFSINPPNTQVSLENDCKIDEGDTGLELKSIGNCYKIHYVGANDFESLVPILATLPTLKEGQEPLIIEDVEKVRNELERMTANLMTFKRYFDPVWSPNSRYVVVTTLENGEVKYGIYTKDQQPKVEVEITSGNPAIRPQWSGNSEYLALASNQSITVIKPDTNYSESIDITPFTKDKNMEILLSFDDENERLLFSFDTNVLFDYELYAFNLNSKEVVKIGDDLDRPSWHPLFDSWQYLHNLRSTSPNGELDAIITKNKDASNFTLERFMQSEDISSSQQHETDDIKTNKKQIADKVVVDIRSGFHIYSFLFGLFFAAIAPLILLAYKKLGKNSHSKPSKIMKKTEDKEFRSTMKK